MYSDMPGMLFVLCKSGMVGGKPSPPTPETWGHRGFPPPSLGEEYHLPLFSGPLRAVDCSHLNVTWLHQLSSAHTYTHTGARAAPLKYFRRPFLSIPLVLSSEIKSPQSGSLFLLFLILPLNVEGRLLSYIDTSLAIFSLDLCSVPARNQALG